MMAQPEGLVSLVGVIKLRCISVRQDVKSIFLATKEKPHRRRHLAIMLFFSTVALLTLVLILTVVPVSSHRSLTVDLGYSKYQGLSVVDGVNQWLGIRYAAPPLGHLRFRAPQDPVLNSSLQVADTVIPLFLSSIPPKASPF